MTDRIVIVGGGLAAARTARCYREAGGGAPLTILSADTRLPYNRPPLSKGFLRGEVEAEAVFVEPAATYAQLDIEIELGTEVVGVDAGARLVALADGTTVGYGRLVLDAPYDLVAFFFSEVFGTKLGLLGDLEAGHDELVVRGSLEDGDLIGFFLHENVLVAALVSGQTPETQNELGLLLRRHAHLEASAALIDPGTPVAAAFSAGEGVTAR